MTQLRTLHLDKSPVSGRGLAGLPSLRELKEFNAQGCPITDEGMSAFRRTPNVRRLDLCETLIGDGGFVHLEGLKHLQAGRFDNTKAGDDAVRHLAGLTEMLVISFDNTQVKGDGLPALRRLNRLAWFDVSCNKRYPKLTTELSAALRDMSSLNRLTCEAATGEETQLHGVPLLRDLTIHCPDGAGKIRLYDLPMLRQLNISCEKVIESVDVSGTPLLGGIDMLEGGTQAYPEESLKIGEIRIRGVKKFGTLRLPAAERMSLPDTERVGWLSICGVLRREALADFQKVSILTELRLVAARGSEPETLRIFADKFAKESPRDQKSLGLVLDRFDAAWAEELGKFKPSPTYLSIGMKKTDAASLRLPNLVDLDSLYLYPEDRIERIDLPRGSMPEELRYFGITGDVGELRFEGWCPKEVCFMSGKCTGGRVVVADLPDRTSLVFSCATQMGIMEIRNVPQLKKLTIGVAEKLKTIVGLAECVELQEVDLQRSAVSDEILATLAKLPELRKLNLRDSPGADEKRVATFRHARPDVGLTVTREYGTPAGSDAKKAETPNTR